MPVVEFPAVCPFCGQLQGVHLNATDPYRQMPRAGDSTICATCEQPAVYDMGPVGLVIRKPMPGELDEYVDQIADALVVLRKVKRRHGITR